MKLTTTDHDRDYAGMRYVYPVVSRRAGGVSIGVNLNPNKACNWRCIYCQVPNLIRGVGPEIDLPVLRAELQTMLEGIVHGDFMEKHAPEGARVLKDIAFSGDGESTSSPQFLAAIEAVEEAIGNFHLASKIKIVLITNGSLVGRKEVQEGLELLGRMGGEVWFKLDRGDDEAIRLTNGVALTIESHIKNLKIAARLVPTWVQTCMFGSDEDVPSDEDLRAYLAVLEALVAEKTPLVGVLLYGMARPPMLPEASNLFRLEAPWLEDLGQRIERLGLDVRVSS